MALASAPGKAGRSTELARKIKEGDHKAFHAFYDLHYESLLRFVISKNTAAASAQDIIQKAFIYIWDHRQNIDPGKSLRAYIFRIAYTRMLNHHRDAKKFNDDTAIPEQQTAITPEDEHRGSELEHAIQQAIHDMPEKRGKVFQLCFMDDFTYKEAARALNITRKTVENHMGLALKDMRESIKKFR